MSDVKDQLIRLGATNPDLQKHIRPLLDALVMKQASWMSPELQAAYNRALELMGSSLEATRDDIAKTRMNDPFSTKSPHTFEYLEQDADYLKYQETKLIEFTRAVREARPLRQIKEALDRGWYVPLYSTRAQVQPIIESFLSKYEADLHRRS